MSSYRVQEKGIFDRAKDYVTQGRSAPFSYCEFWKNRGDQKLVDADQQFRTSRCPGVAIMKAVASRTKPGDNALAGPEKFQLWVQMLFDEFVRYSRAHDWTWSPGTTDSLPTLIDGTMTLSQCAAFAYSFMCLAVAPPPFGLGVPFREFVYETYLGTGKVVGGDSYGFISEHPRDGCLNLKPNVYTRIGSVHDENLNGVNFYLWSNHKVIKYKGLYYDPSYGCLYESIMAWSGPHDRAWFNEARKSKRTYRGKWGEDRWDEIKL